MTRQPVLSQAAGFDAGRWAAEELALQLGWLRECPYHGEPFRTPGSEAVQPHAAQSRARQLGEHESEVYSLALQLSTGYSERCPVCARESAVPE